MKTANIMTKEKRKNITNAQKIVDLMHSIGDKINKAKENPSKVDLVELAKKTGKEMVERRQRTLSEEK